MNANLFDRLQRSVLDTRSTAITTLAGETYTYADLIALSGRLANVLVSRGVKPGDRVAVQVEKSVPALVLYLATVRAGAFPYNAYYHLLARVEDTILAYAGMFLEDAYDPDQHDRYDGVPFPGVTCVQALMGDSYAGAWNAATISCHLNDGGLVMPPAPSGGTLETIA